MLRKVFCVVFLLAVAAGLAATGEVIERVVATVNGQPILQSDWDEEFRYEAFMNRKPLESLTVQDRKQALDRVIDQELLRQQIKGSEFEEASAQEPRDRIAELRKQFPEVKDDAGWKTKLEQYGMTEQDLTRHIALQLQLTRLITARLRPNVHIDSSSIETYYREKLLPQLRQSGVKNVPLVEVSPKIEELLAQQRVNELLAGWLHDLRAQSEIRTAGQAEGVASR
jgi:parvulin-like peptidyl-prolyl isomerase